MWATPENPDRCPVALFKKFVSHRLKDMCQPDSPFYLAINHKRADYSLWYKKQPLGINHIDKMMKLVIAGTSITGRKTNHSARKTMVETLCRSNIPDSTVMQLSGHKSVQSLNHYKKPSLDQQRSISHLLSSHSEPSPVPLSSDTGGLSRDKSTSHASTSPSRLSGPFSNAALLLCAEFQWTVTAALFSQQLLVLSTVRGSLNSQEAHGPLRFERRRLNLANNYLDLCS